MNLLSFILKVGSSVAIAALVAAAGAAIVHFDTAPWRYVNSKLDKYSSAIKASMNNGYYDIETILLPLEARPIDVPVDRGGSGGGLAAFGDGVILVSRLGRLFYSEGPENVRELDVRLPDNGLAAYREAAQLLPDLQHDFTRFRFNDILVFDRTGGTQIWVTSTIFDPEEICIRSAVFALTLPIVTRDPDAITGDATDWKVVFRTQPCLPLKETDRAIEGHMAGGRMDIGPDGRIYLGSSAYKWSDTGPEAGLAQKPDNDYGKIIAIDPDSFESAHFSVGHRNMQGVAFDASGRLLVTEHGMRGGDELNIVQEGKDYGFSSVTLGSTYDSGPISDFAQFGRHSFFEPPVYAWLPSIAPSSLNLISGFHPFWDGDMIMGSLKDQSLYRLRLRGERLLFAERIPIGERIRYAQIVNGWLVVWTDGWSLIWIKPSGSNFYEDFLADYLDASELSGEQRDRLARAITSCRECHALGLGDAGILPGLASLVGADIGKGPASSLALKNHGGTWTTKLLAAYIRSPQSFAKGTLMPDPGISDHETIDDLVKFLVNMSSARPQD